MATDFGDYGLQAPPSNTVVARAEGGHVFSPEDCALLAALGRGDLSLVTRTDIALSDTETKMTLSRLVDGDFDQAIATLLAEHPTTQEGEDADAVLAKVADFIVSKADPRIRLFFQEKLGAPTPNFGGRNLAELIKKSPDAGLLQQQFEDYLAKYEGLNLLEIGRARDVVTSIVKRMYGPRYKLADQIATLRRHAQQLLARAGGSSQPVPEKFILPSQPVAAKEIGGTPATVEAERGDRAKKEEAEFRQKSFDCKTLTRLARLVKEIKSPIVGTRETFTGERVAQFIEEYRARKVGTRKTHITHAWGIRDAVEAIELRTKM